MPTMAKLESNDAFVEVDRIEFQIANRKKLT